MSSHSRSKGKPRKSAASSVQKTASPGPLNADRAIRKDQNYTLTSDDIQRAVDGAVDTLPGEATLPAKFVEKYIGGEHPGMSVDADREDQCAVHLAASIVTALRPFLGPQGG